MRWQAATVWAAMAAALLGSAAAFAHPPYGLAVDRSGSAYFSDLETVWRLFPDGRLAVFRPHVPGSHVHEVALAPDGTVEGDQNRYDPATQRFYTGLWRRTAEGRERMVVPMSEDSPAGFGVWQDGRGNRYASHWPSTQDRRTMLTRRSPDGRSEMVFAEGRPARPAKGSVAGVGGMAFGPDGSVYFADRNLLRRLGPDGRTRLLHRGGAGSSLRGIALATDGRVLAADMGLKAVIAVAPDGPVETLYRETGPWLPTAVAAAGGRLLVLEANSDQRDYDNRVRLVEVKGGQPRVIAVPSAGPASAAALPAVQADHGGFALPAVLFVAVAAGLAVVLAPIAMRRLTGKE